MSGTQQHSRDREVFCAFCGYNLCALPLDGKCPECGHAVRASLADERLPVPNDPRWMWRLSHGTTLLLWGVIVFVSHFVVGAILPLSPGTGGAPAWLGPCRVALTIIERGGAALVLWGAYFLGSPDPRHDPVGIKRVIRLGSRWGWLAAGLFVAALWASARWWTVRLPLLMLLVASLSLLWVCMVLAHLVVLTGRIPSKRLRRGSLACFVLFVSSLLLEGLRFAIVAIGPQGAGVFAALRSIARVQGSLGQPTGAFFDLLQSIGGCLSLIFWVLTLAVLAGARKAFKRAAQQSQERLDRLSDTCK